MPQLSRKLSASEKAVFDFYYLTKQDRFSGNIVIPGSNHAATLESFESSSFDETSKIIELAFLPVENDIPQVFLNGVLQRPNSDYVIAEKAVTFSEDLYDSDVVLVKYLRKDGDPITMVFENGFIREVLNND